MNTMKMDTMKMIFMKTKDYENSKLLIKDLRENDIVNDEKAIFVVTRAEIRRKRDGNNYYFYEFADSTGTIIGRLWEPESELISEGNFVKLIGKVTKFNGEVYINIEDIQVITINEIYKAGIPLETLIKISPLIKKSSSIIFSEIEKIKNTYLKNRLKEFLSQKEIYDVYFTLPAAVYYHHNYIGGLSEHVANMLEIFNSVDGLYKNVDNDVVRAGIILHDIGKIEEYKINNFAIDINKEALLNGGHLVLGLKIINELFSDCTDKYILQKMQSIILQHHGKMEYGSPFTPNTLEALVVFLIDNFESSLNKYLYEIDELLENNKGAQNQNWIEAPSKFLKDFPSSRNIYLGLADKRGQVLENENKAIVKYGFNGENVEITIEEDNSSADDDIFGLKLH